MPHLALPPGHPLAAKVEAKTMVMVILCEAYPSPTTSWEASKTFRDFAAVDITAATFVVHAISIFENKTIQVPPSRRPPCVSRSSLHPLRAYPPHNKIVHTTETGNHMESHGQSIP